MAEMKGTTVMQLYVRDTEGNLVNLCTSVTVEVPIATIEMTADNELIATLDTDNS